MAEYYLVSQLPSLDGIGDNVPLPITEERFTELCNSLLGKKAREELSKLTLAPSRTPEKSGSALVEAWNDGERNLRLVLAKLRAEKMNKQFDMGNKSLPVNLVQAARTAVDAATPMEAEKILNRYRLDFLETLRPMDTFSQDFVFYYGLKLKLIMRIRQFDTASGEAAYRNIYDSIINSDRSEVTQ